MAARAAARASSHSRMQTASAASARSAGAYRARALAPRACWALVTGPESRTPEVFVAWGPPTAPGSAWR